MRHLLYPLGFVASSCFALRFIIQWIISERRGQSLVIPLFWRLSLVGNFLMFLHTFIQSQIPLCLIQTFNGMISWRNLDLMREKPKPLSFMLFLSSLTLAATLALAYFLSPHWMRVPTTTDTISLPWHIIGVLGTTIFAMRFWLQWWESERSGKSLLSSKFWSWSLIGACIALAYFIRLNDWVNILGYGLGIIPYIRNLILIKKVRT